MKHLKKRPLLGRKFKVLLIAGMTIGALISSESTWGQDRLLKPPLGQESDILFSIPKGGHEKLPGTSVSRLPSSCTRVSRRDFTYYSCEGIYLQPYFRGSKVVYMVIEKPG